MKYCAIICLLLMARYARAQQAFHPPGNKVLVVSGGGARGAWGVGVVSERYKRSGGYKAVFGASTGSLMASFILLQQFDALAYAYSNVTQQDIFSCNPFKVTYDSVTNTVTTKIRAFKTVLRLLLGKKTLGESKNLLNLIHQYLTKEKFDSLVGYYKTQHLVMAVAVTNTRTGGIEIKTDTGYNKTAADYNTFCRWIWASANEPLFMSYVPMDGSSYVDGGVREVIPVQEALRYAVLNGIDSVEVIINNGKVAEDQNWNVNAGGIIYGLQRLLAIYNLSTAAYNENYAELMGLYYRCAHTLPPGLLNPAVAHKTIHLSFYCMPDSLAHSYANELGFVKAPMVNLLQQGRLFGQSPQNCFETDLDESSIRTMLKMDK